MNEAILPSPLLADMSQFLYLVIIFVQLVLGCGMLHFVNRTVRQSAPRRARACKPPCIHPRAPCFVSEHALAAAAGFRAAARGPPSGRVGPLHAAHPS